MKELHLGHRDLIAVVTFAFLMAILGWLKWG